MILLQASLVYHSYRWRGFLGMLIFNALDCAFDCNFYWKRVLYEAMLAISANYLISVSMFFAFVSLFSTLLLFIISIKKMSALLMG